jgi:hypothetical protein
MSELESYIFKEFLKNMKRFQEKFKKSIKDGVGKCLYITSHFRVGGCFDTIHYDIKLGKFSEIEYRYGKKNGFKLLDDYNAYFDREDIEIRKINLIPYDLTLHTELACNNCVYHITKMEFMGCWKCEYDLLNDVIDTQNQVELIRDKIND